MPLSRDPKETLGCCTLAVQAQEGLEPSAPAVSPSIPHLAVHGFLFPSVGRGLSPSSGGATGPARVAPGWLDKEVSLRVTNGKDTCHKHKKSSKATQQAPGLLPTHVLQGKLDR